MLTESTLYGVEYARLEGELPLQARILLRSYGVDEREIRDIIESGKLSSTDDVSEAYDVILGRW